MYTLFIYFAVCLSPLLGFSNEAHPFEAPLTVDFGGEDHFFREFINMLATLGLIVATIFFISWFLKRMVNARIQQVNVSNAIKIIEQRPLSAKSTLYLVEVYDKQLILGETHTGVTVLGEFPVEPEEKNPIKN